MANALVCEPNRFAFAEPRVPSLEVCVPLVLGERVVWIPDDNSGPEHGTVRWMGKLPEMGQDWVAGVELDNPAGKHDGRWANRQLFLTKPKHGLIIPIMGLIKEEEFIGHSHITDSSPQQIVRGLPPDPPGWYDNIEYHNAHRAKSESQFWKRLRNDSTTTGFQNERSSKVSRLQGSRPEFSDDTNTLEVNKLLRKLEVSIATGHIDEAAGLARQLAMLKVNCSVVRNKPRVDDNASEEICLNLFVEDRTSHIGPINLYVNPSMTVGDLKKKIENNFDFPSNLQRWILGKKLASDDSVPLSEFDIHTNGCTVFLYLMTTDIDIASAYKQRLESYLKALEDLDLEDDFSDDEVTSHFQSEEEANFNVLSGDHSRTACIPTDQRNGHDGSEGSLSQPNNSRKLRHSAEALEMVYAGARPKQLQNDVTSRTQENMIKKEEGWNCPACTMLNLPTRPGCEMCATARPENYIIPKEYVPKPEEEERLRKERQLEIELEQTREKERLENYQRLLAIDDMDVVLNDEAFECPVCFTDIDVGEGIRIRDCLHVFCRDCLAHAVEYSETAEVKCPFRDNDYSCPNVLQHREIQALVTQEVYDRHLQKSVTTAESQAENSFHCKTANCLAWCYFEDNINEFPCPICDHVNCLTCQAIHEEMNCKQYQDKVEFEAATNDAARKTKEALDEMLTKGQAMRCPKCQVILMKKWGCDWICCSMCKTEICWVTKGHRWGPAGQGDTSAGCRCGVNGVRCHAQCNYCH